MKPANYALAVILAGGAVFGAMALGARADDGSITFGSERLRENAPEAKYEEFSDYPKGPYIDNFAWRREAGRRLFTLTGDRALRDDQSSEFRYADGVRCGLDIGYQRTPHNITWNTRNSYYQTSPGVYTLPDSLQARAQSANSAGFTALMNDFLNNAHPENMSFRTDVSRARLRGRPAPGWKFEVTGSERRRTGEKPYAVTFGFSNAVEIPEPIDQRTLNADASASYARDGMRVRLNGGVSSFYNHVGSITLDNPHRLTDSPTAGSGRGLLDLYPDNRSIRGGVDAAYNIDPKNQLTASILVSHDTQNDDWLPYTINSALRDTITADGMKTTRLDQVSALPGKSTDAKATTLSQNYRLTSRTFDNLTEVVRFTRSKYSNNTPIHVFPGSVTYDQTWAPGPDTTSAPSHSITTTGFDLDFDATSRLTVSGTAEYIQTERTDREVAKNKETALSGEARLRPADGVNLRGSYRYGNRKVDSFDVDAYDNAEQAGLRRFDVAARKQNKVDASASWSPGTKAVFSAGYNYLKNDYNESDLGLSGDRQQSISLDGILHPNDRVNLTGGIGRIDLKTDQKSVQAGSSSLPAYADSGWTATIKNWSVYAYGNAEVQAVPGRVTLTGGLEYQRAPTRFELSNVPGTAQNLPDTRYRRRDLTFGGDITVDPSTQVGLRWNLEKFDAQDFAAQGITLLNPPTGSSTAIFLGDNVLNYTASRLALVVKHTF